MSRQRPREVEPRRERSPGPFGLPAVAHLLLVAFVAALVVGLAAMHTLGHPGHSEHSAHTAQPGRTAPAAGGAAGGAALTSAIAADHGAHAGAHAAQATHPARTLTGSHRDGPPPLDPFTMCLAALLALAVLAGPTAALLRSLRRLPARPGSLRAQGRAGERAPPGRGLGLLLRSSVVLRI